MASIAAVALMSLVASMAAPPPADQDIVLTSIPVTRELTLPDLNETRDHYALRVVGVAVAPNNPALFRVFVELPDASRSTPAGSEHYVGQVSILAGPSRAAKNVIMPLNWPHERKLSSGTRLRFTLVPSADYSATPIRVAKLEITSTHP